VTPGSRNDPQHEDRTPHPRIEAAPITKALRASLKAEIKRTGASAQLLLKNAPDLPDGLNGSIVNRWIGGIIRSAPQRHVDYVLAKWRSLPDHAGRLYKHRSKPPMEAKLSRSNWPNHRPISEADLATLKAHRQRTNIGAIRLLSGATDIPPGLTPNVVSSWLTGKGKAADPAHLAYVLARWDAHGR
jgi:hypothetical protein